jgi:uncharacterized membrane protein
MDRRREATTDGEKETGRVEAFSDGVFAIAMTLLILDVKVPRADATAGPLLQALGRQWPNFLAYLTSFGTILVMWVNHHRMFTHIRRVDQAFLFLNGLLLLLVTFIPFPTGLVAEYIEHPEARTAAAILSATYFALALAFNLLWGYASSGGRLLDARTNLARAQEITKQYRFGPISYLVAFGLAFVSVPASLALIALLALFFAFTGALPRLFGSPDR